MAYTDAKKRLQGTFDAELLFHDGAAAMTATGAGVVEGSARVNSVGTGCFRGVMVLDISSISCATDEAYVFSVQGSDDEFSTNRELASVTLGKVNTETPGRFKIYFDNEANGTYFKQLRIYVTASGTAKSVTFQAYAVKQE